MKTFEYHRELAVRLRIVCEVLDKLQLFRARDACEEAAVSLNGLANDADPQLRAKDRTTV
jgi:hypothetical protein